MNDLTITDSSLRDRLIPQQYSLELAFGADENDFTLTLPDGVGMDVGECFYVPETEWGGVVDRRTTDLAYGGNTVTYYGRSWHGVLANSVLCPDAGSDYLKYSGDLNEVIASVVERQGLASLFSVPEVKAGKAVSGSFDRYADAYSALAKLCRANGFKLSIRKGGGAVSLSAVAAPTVYLDSDMYDLRMGEGRYTNHLVCLGSGELKDRVVVHLYMDGSGNVSKTQTQTGVAEIAEVYDYNNAAADELAEKGAERLAECFGDSCELEISDGLLLDVGDPVHAVSVETGIEVEAVVEKVVVTAEDGAGSASYEVGSITRKS